MWVTSSLSAVTRNPLKVWPIQFFLFFQWGPILEWSEELGLFHKGQWSSIRCGPAAVQLPCLDVAKTATATNFIRFPSCWRPVFRGNARGNREGGPMGILHIFWMMKRQRKTRLCPLGDHELVRRTTTKSLSGQRMAQKDDDDDKEFTSEDCTFLF